MVCVTVLDLCTNGLSGGGKESRGRMESHRKRRCRWSGLQCSMIPRSQHAELPLPVSVHKPREGARGASAATFLSLATATALAMIQKQELEASGGKEERETDQGGEGVQRTRKARVKRRQTGNETTQQTTSATSSCTRRCSESSWYSFLRALAVVERSTAVLMLNCSSAAPLLPLLHPAPRAPPPSSSVRSSPLSRTVPALSTSAYHTVSRSLSLTTITPSLAISSTSSSQLERHHRKIYEPSHVPHLSLTSLPVPRLGLGQLQQVSSTGSFARGPS